MSSDRPSGRRRPRRRASTPEETPEVVVAEMEQATQRLRDQAWKINATTKTPLIAERDLTRDTESTESAPRDS